MSEAHRRRLRGLGAALAGLGLAGFAATLCRRGIVLSDEGYVLQLALDLRDGRVLYRDLDAFVTPGIWWVLAATFRALEPSVLASRLPAWLTWLASVALVGRLVRGLAGARYALGAVAALAVLSVWAFPGWTFAFYSPVAVLFALAALERLLAWGGSRRGLDLLACGIALGLSLAFKQNYGALATLGVLAGLPCLAREQAGSWAGAGRRMPGALAWLGGGGLAVGLPLIAGVAASGALDEAFQSLVVHLFEFSGRHHIPYLPLSTLWSLDPLGGGAEWTYGAHLFVRLGSPLGGAGALHLTERLHVLLYWLPPLVLLGTLGLALHPAPGRRSPDARLLAVAALAGLLFLGVFPRADFHHLLSVYPPIVVAAAAGLANLGARLPVPRPRVVRVAGAALLGAMALIGAVAGFWYRDLLSRWDTPLPGPRGGVLLPAGEAHRLGELVHAIREATAEGEAVLTVPDLAMLNFLAQRPVPSAWYNLYEHHVAADGGAAVVSAARARDVRLAVTRYDDFFSSRVGLRRYAPALAEFLLREFELRWVVAQEEYLWLERRAAPLPDRPGSSALERCDVPGDEQSARVVRDHLLFTTLYHAPRLAGVAPPLETRCRVEVPPGGAVLALRIGYRPPARAEPGSLLEAEIAASVGDREALLFERPMAVRAGGAWRRPAHPELRLDLSGFAGREIDLIFRTRWHGRAQPFAGDFRGFAMIFEDVRVEASRS